jgi:serine/threonine protein kinase
MACHGDLTILVLDDPGGMPLDQVLGQPLEGSHGLAPRGDLAVFLRLAIGLSTAIGHLHRRGIIHKDIKPANVLANSDTGQCWLTGFGIASRLPREGQSPEPPEFIAGTLAYMAPEQTGRMNRSIDSRSDLYALGVTLLDLSEQKRAEEERQMAQDALHQAQVELARVSRMKTMEQLTASIAHEVNQPLAAVVATGNACLNWL